MDVFVSDYMAWNDNELDNLDDYGYQSYEPDDYWYGEIDEDEYARYPEDYYE